MHLSGKKTQSEAEIISATAAVAAGRREPAFSLPLRREGEDSDNPAGKTNTNAIARLGDLRLVVKIRDSSVSFVEGL